jgi:hypothetical protein
MRTSIDTFYENGNKLKVGDFLVDKNDDLWMIAQVLYGGYSLVCVTDGSGNRWFDPLHEIQYSVELRLDGTYLQRVDIKKMIHGARYQEKFDADYISAMNFEVPDRKDVHRIFNEKFKVGE